MKTSTGPSISHRGINVFAVVVELLELIGFGVGFYAIVHTPIRNMQNDLKNLDLDGVKDEVTMLVDSAIESRTMAFVALALVVAAFILRTIVGRSLRIRTMI